MRMFSAILMLSVAAQAASFEFDDPSTPTNAPAFFTVWRYQWTGPVQIMRVPVPTNLPPRIVRFSVTLPLGTNTLSVTAHSLTEQSPYSNLLFFTNAPVVAPIGLRLAPMRANVSLVITGAVTFTE